MNVLTENVANSSIDVHFAINTGMALSIVVKQPKVVTHMEEELVKTRETTRGMTIGIDMRRNMASKIITMSTNKVQFMFDLYYRSTRQQQLRNGTGA